MLTKVDLIIRHIEDLIDRKQVAIGNQVPSLTNVMEEFRVSRDTVVRAYKILSYRGIINSIPGKGYFVLNDKTTHQINIFLLLDELSLYKNTLVKSIEKSLNHHNGHYRIFFHHYDANRFVRLIQQNLDLFTHYVISPFPDSPEVKKGLEILKDKRLILLDRNEDMDKNIRFVGQEFDIDITIGLKKLKNRLKHYRRLIFIFPKPSHHPKTLISGFEQFCQSQNINHHIVRNFNEVALKHLDSFIVIHDNDLANIVLKTRAKNWKLGEDIGLISYNETTLKSVVAEGITTISTDFDLMGKNLIKMILNPNEPNIHNPSNVTIRKSY